MNLNELSNPEQIEQLAKCLDQFRSINRFDVGNEKEAWTLVYGLSEILGSCDKIRNEHLPLLLRKDLTEERAQEILFDIGEEFRHVLYHIKDSKFFAYLEK